MNNRLTNVRLVTLAGILCLLAFVSLGNTNCGKNKDGTPKTPEQAAAEKIDSLAFAQSVVARGTDAGITTVHAYRVAGKVKSEKALSLARKAQKENDANEKIAQFLLGHDGQEAGATLLDDARELLDLARDIEGDALSDNVNFNLGVAAADVGLQIAVDEFGAKLPAGVKITLTPVTRAKLEETIRVTQRNRQRLSAAIAELEQAAATNGAE